MQVGSGNATWSPDEAAISQASCSRSLSGQVARSVMLSILANG